MNKILLFSLLIFSSSLHAQIIVSDDGSGTGTTTWTANNTYILDGMVFVNSGDELTIEPGTIIKGMPGSGAEASALIVARGGKINAVGTQENPIIFTFEQDALDGSTPYNTKGQWGGVIILGNAQLNSSPGETQIEGIPDTESRGLYGGNDDLDNSGTMTYVSIRHGGTDIGAGNEINGLTLGGVGSQTTLEYIEVIANADDGVEFFGGTASIKYVLTAFCGDDSFDYDEGWRGYGQFWCTVQEEGDGDRGGEHDGGTDPEDGLPYAHPIISNATYIGQGTSAGKRAITLRDNAGGEYHKSIFFNWGKGIDIENLASGEDCYQRFINDEIKFSENIFDQCTNQGINAEAQDIFKVTMGSGWPSLSDSTNALNESSATFQNSFISLGNQNVESGLSYNIEEGSGSLALIPDDGLTSESIIDLPSWFDTTDFPGAFDPNLECTWLEGWSMLSNRGFIGCGNNILEEINTNFIKTFPNPTDGNLQIVCNKSLIDASIEVRDLNGRLIQKETRNIFANENLLINIDSKPGVYVISIIDEDLNLHSKIILE